MPGLPIPVPWPNPPPGIPIPAPRQPVPVPGFPIPVPDPGPITTSPILTSPGPSFTPGVTGPFSDLFKFVPDWALIGALILVALSVEFVDQTYPEYVWMYVGILLLGIILLSPGFTPQLNRWLGR